MTNKNYTVLILDILLQYNFIVSVISDLTSHLVITLSIISMATQRHILEQLAALRESLFNSPLNILWSESPYTVKIHIKKSFVKLNTPEQVAPSIPNRPNSPNSLTRCTTCEHTSSALRQAEHGLRESRMVIETLEAARIEAAERINALSGNLARAESAREILAEEAETAREALISQLDQLKTELSQANSKLSAVEQDRDRIVERTDSAKKILDKNLEQIKSELSQRNAQLKSKNKALNDQQNQFDQITAEQERARSNLTKKVDNLLRKNANLQSELDEAKQKVKEERASHKKKRKGKDKAIQIQMDVPVPSLDALTAHIVCKPPAAAATMTAEDIPKNPSTVKVDTDSCPAPAVDTVAAVAAATDTAEDAADAVDPSPPSTIIDSSGTEWPASEPAWVKSLLDIMTDK